MKLLYIIASVLVCIGPAYSQGMMEEGQLDEPTTTENGGYGAPVIKVARINQSDGILNGVKGAWIINHNYGLGAAAYALVNNINFDGYNEPLEFAYGGIVPEYILFPERTVSYSASLLLGAGFLDFNDNSSGSDGVLVAEPELSVLFNVTENFRISLNGSYRAVADTDLASVSNDKLSGFNYGLALQIGEF